MASGLMEHRLVDDEKVANEPSPNITAVGTGRAAVFAIHAIGQAGLREQDGTYADYDITVRDSVDSWTAHFDPPEDCTHGTNTNENDGKTEIWDDTQSSAWQCKELTELPLYIYVEISAGSFVVEQVDGPVDESTRQKILEYREPATRLEASFEVTDLEITHTTGNDVVHGTVLWTGKAKALPVIDTCHLYVLDETGRAISRSKYFHLLATTDHWVGPTLDGNETMEEELKDWMESFDSSAESRRDGHFHIFKRWVRGDAARAEIRCEPAED